MKNIFYYTIISLSIITYSNNFSLENNSLKNNKETILTNNSETFSSIIDIDGLENNKIIVDLKNKSSHDIILHNKKKFPVTVEINIYTENEKETTINLFPQCFVINENDKQNVTIDSSKFNKLNNNKFNIEFRVSNIILNNYNDVKEYSKTFELIVNDD